MKKRKLGRGVAVAGAGMSKFGMFPDKDSKDLFTEAFNEMLASVDKGVDPNDIDALYLGNFSNDFFTHQAHWGPLIADIIGNYCWVSGVIFGDTLFYFAYQVSTNISTLGEDTATGSQE